MKRKASVAGYFYPNREKDLRHMIKEMVEPTREREKGICIVSPHAGFVYSGPVAGAVFSSVHLPGRYVVLGPSHRGIESRLAIMTQGVWETPLGDVPVDNRLAKHILRHSEGISEDLSAHADEHSLEVQLPFIQYFKEEVSIVPVCIAPQASFEDLEDLGVAVAKGIKEVEDEVMIVASTDMSHYVDQEVARKKDFLAIDRILELDAPGLYETVQREHISMCGFQPTTAAIIASLELGAKKAELIKYQTSGDVSGNFREVVGYAGIRIR